MVTPTFVSRCTMHRKIAEGVFEFSLKKPEGFFFKAGQFVMFRFPLIEKPTDIQPRAFSIASAPEEEELLFVAKIKEGGRAGRWISEAMHEGSDVTFQGPLGNFLLDEKTEKPYLFIATCSGVAPFRSQIVHALKAGDRRKMDLVFGVHAEENMFWRKEFDALAREYPNLSVFVPLSQPSAAWKGLAGHVQDVVPQVIKDSAQRSVYICGNPEMVKEVKGIALEKWNIKPSDFHSEDYV
ncbi:MAG: FAD-binding oxidoreductase [Candidatus Peribacteraceae bacterium]|nr:FAD-binding oxidoreductase [Candidatus Peribacteraceae bacterium]MDD5074675.1 FAD-binding oxidoreductase [Candidatus Peribacteraceae bacterium]